MELQRFTRTIVAAAALMAIPTADVRAQFTISLNFTGGLTASQQAAFVNARNTWQSLVTGYRPGIAITGITIDARGEAIDGPGGSLGSAGPTTGVNQGGFILATAGLMRFDTADLPTIEGNGTFGNVVLHEMAHVMGFGTLWDDNNVYINGSGQYSGVNSLAVYNAEYTQVGAFIPVELAGGLGTANGHWNENDGGGSPTGITDLQGRDFRNELMTGWLNTPTYISNTTLYQFRDLGFTTLVAVPEPTSFALVGIAAAGGWVIRRRRAAKVT